MRALLQKRVEVKCADADGTTALHWAVRADDSRSSQRCCAPAPTRKAANRYGVTPLSLAAINGNAAMIEALLAAGADAEQRGVARTDGADDGRADRQCRRASERCSITARRSNAREEAARRDGADVGGGGEPRRRRSRCCWRAAPTSTRAPTTLKFPQGSVRPRGRADHRCRTATGRR